MDAVTVDVGVLVAVCLLVAKVDVTFTGQVVLPVLRKAWAHSVREAGVVRCQWHMRYVSAAVTAPFVLPGVT